MTVTEEYRPSVIYTASRDAGEALHGRSTIVPSGDSNGMIQACAM